MKKALLEKLSKIDPPANRRWFWRKYIQDQIGVTYQHFLNMLNKDAAMRADVNRAINDYLKEV